MRTPGIVVATVAVAVAPDAVPGGEDLRTGLQVLVSAREQVDGVRQQRPEEGHAAVGESSQTDGLPDGRRR
jgi:hypothetical protein